MNARSEFLNHVGNSLIKCASLSYSAMYGDENSPIILREHHTYVEYENFLEKLDFNYDRGYGLQQLFGTIWYMDGTWSSRGEYDGSEWWERNIIPEIPAHCK